MHREHLADELAVQAVALEQADAVLAGDGAPEGERRRSTMSSNAACARARASSSPGGRDQQRVQVAVAGVGDVGDQDVVRARASRSMRASISGTRPRGTHTSSVSTGPSALQRRVGQPPGVEQRLGLDRVGRPLGPARTGRLEARAGSPRPPAPPAGSRPVDPAEQHAVGVVGEAHVFHSSTARRQCRSTSSSADGLQAAAPTAATAAPAATTEAKNPTTVRARADGRGRSRTVTSVTTPSVPSEPTISPTRS